MEDMLALLTNKKAELARAQQRVRVARQKEAKIVRAIHENNRRLVAQQKLSVGASVMKWAEADERFRAALLRGLPRWLTRETDRACLRGTVLDLDAVIPATEPAAESTEAGHDR